MDKTNSGRQFFMHRAVELAVYAVENGLGGPFGAVVVKDGVIIGEGYNQVTSTNDPTAHAEIMAIRNACQQLGSFQLTGCEMYSSCEPCPMCLGAIYWARPLALYFCSDRYDAAKAGFDDSFIYDEMVSLVKNRKMPMFHLPCIKAEEPFRLWNVKESKMKY
jgi:guanine deaminase